MPLASAQSRWISGHYCDEFAEAHGKSLLVREALGAAMPSAGVGCAFNRDDLGALAAGRRLRDHLIRRALPRITNLACGWARRAVGAFWCGCGTTEGGLIATQEYFPDTLGAAVRQKARWTVGIALAGWDRLGWSVKPGDIWMRLRDRRATLAAVILLAAYLGMVIGGRSVGCRAIDAEAGQSLARNAHVALAGKCGAAGAGE